MLKFIYPPPMKEKSLLLRALKRDPTVCLMLKPNTEENVVAAIYDDGILCGGALLLGKDVPVYLFCFFESTKNLCQTYHHQIRGLISSSFPEIKMFDIVHCIHF